ncbi:MAG: tetratricopeptide repeat protein [Acidobacteriota bacterium]|nr:tetratricopeptide repeat protein [Acidobacteriota bacterium]
MEDFPDDWRPTMIARILKALLVVAMAASAWSVQARWRALRLSVPGGISDYESALAIDRDNPEFHYRLALVLRDDASSRDLDAAADHLGWAIELNPHAWSYHFEHGRALELLGDASSAEAAYRRGLEHSPAGSRYHWRLANFYLREGNTYSALSPLAEAIREDASLRAPAYGLLRGLGSDLVTVIEVWPEDSPALGQLLRLVLADAQARDEESLPTIQGLWSQLVEVGEEISPGLGSLFIDYLAASGDVAGARQAWTEFMAQRGVRDPLFESNRNALWNGGFEAPLSEAGLGWRIPELPGMHFEQVDPDCARGDGCARLTFENAENPTALGLEQFANVEVPRSYRLSFLARSLGLSGDQGPYMEVVVAASGARLASTDPIMGSSDWKLYEASFATETGTERVVVRLRRDRSLRLDKRFSGVLWLDEVLVEEVEP